MLYIFTAVYVICLAKLCVCVWGGGRGWGGGGGGGGGYGVCTLAACTISLLCIFYYILCIMYIIINSMFILYSVRNALFSMLLYGIVNYVCCIHFKVL